MNSDPYVKHPRPRRRRWITGPRAAAGGVTAGVVLAGAGVWLTFGLGIALIVLGAAVTALCMTVDTGP